MKTTHLLVSACMVLGLLVWLDNSGDDRSGNSRGGGSSEQSARANGMVEAAPNAFQEAGNPAGADRAAVSNPLSVVDREMLSATVGRPLFAPVRSRPPVEESVEVAVAPPPPPPPPSYVLLGVVSDNGHAIALLRRVADGTSFRVEVGDMIGGWHVASIEVKAIRLEREDGTSRTVPLIEQSPKPNSAPPLYTGEQE